MSKQVPKNRSAVDIFTGLSKTEESPSREAQAHRTSRGGTRRFNARRALVYAILALLLLYAFFPTFWLISTSFKPQLEAFVNPPTWWPRTPTLQSYEVLPSDERGFVQYFKNSLIISSCATFLTLLAATPAGYALSRFRFTGTHALILVILATQMFPYVTILISLYTLFRQLHMLNTYPALILAFTTFSLPFSIWIVKGLCDRVPTDIEDAARVDGQSRLGVLLRIVLPLIFPGVIVVGTFAFLDAWNELLFALTLTSSSAMRTIPAGFVLTYIGEFQNRWPDLMAASAVMSLPRVLGFMIFQQPLVKGLIIRVVKS
jgi:multiple sugar transport system permease protein